MMSGKLWQPNADFCVSAGTPVPRGTPGPGGTPGYPEVSRGFPGVPRGYPGYPRVPFWTRDIPGYPRLRLRMVFQGSAS
jgi:hypothetical protein